MSVPFEEPDMSSLELDALIIEHIVDLDRAEKRIDAIEQKLVSAMNARAEQWAKRHGWTGKFILPENGGWQDWEIDLAPADWNKTGDEADVLPKCFFTIDVRAGDTEEGKPGEPWNYVTRFCGLEGGQIGIRFVKTAPIRKRQWQGIVERFRDEVSSTKFIVDSEPSFFLGFCIDPTALAAAFREDDPDAALGPFDTALDALIEARPAFDKLVEHLRAQGS
jgi:hypothetical protein